jgi:phage gp36-like protein
MGYITKDEFILMSVMPATYIGEIETKTPGWINKQIDMASARVDTQLRKRYDVPFSDPAPVMVKEWVARMVEVSCWLKRGVRTTDEQFQEYRARGDTALKELEEAANSEKGPLRFAAVHRRAKRDGDAQLAAGLQRAVPLCVD